MVPHPGEHIRPALRIVSSSAPLAALSAYHSFLHVFMCMLLYPTSVWPYATDSSERNGCKTPKSKQEEGRRECNFSTWWEPERCRHRRCGMTCPAPEFRRARGPVRVRLSAWPVSWHRPDFFSFRSPAGCTAQPSLHSKACGGQTVLDSAASWHTAQLAHNCLPTLLTVDEAVVLRRLRGERWQQT